MKRLLVFVFLLPIICTSQYTAIPDQVFEQKLIDLGHDTILDGQVLTANIVNLDSLNVNGFPMSPSINDLSGIEDFTNLTFLDCGWHYLVSLDVSQNTNLKTLKCQLTYLNSLDLSQNTALTYLDCSSLPVMSAQNNLINLDLSQNVLLEYLNCASSGLSSLDITQNNQLKFLNTSMNTFQTLDISQNQNLIELYCVYNGLSTLNLSQNVFLETLNCSGNGLSSLDVSQNTNLVFLDCGPAIFLFNSILDSNQITSLDVSQNTALTYLNCNINRLTSLDVSQNTALTYLNCNNNRLISLDVRNGNNINFTDFNATNNDSLICISVDDSTWSATNWMDIDMIANFSNDCNPSTANINEIEKKLSIYPNPTSEEITISVENFSGGFEAKLYSFTGKLLETTNKTAISLADYPTGIYLLKVSYGDRIEEVKVVKE